jgi:hypothetical protein
MQIQNFLKFICDINWTLIEVYLKNNNIGQEINVKVLLNSAL